MLLTLTIASVLLVLTGAITLIRNDFWIFRVFEYPRLQKLLLMILCMIGLLLYWDVLEKGHLALLGLLAGFSVYYCTRIFPYSKFWPKEIRRIVPSQEGADLRIFAANVLQDNQAYDRMLQQIKETDPDIIFLLETNKAWAAAMQELSATHPYTLLEPLENTYGLLFFSRLKLRSGRIMYRVKDDIPSVEAIVELGNGQAVQLWGVHPEPPVPGENLFATAKDKELMKIALLARECKLPCIVFGDLNDVAWSHTTKLFRKTSGLLDPRIGRGFYSTFSAHHWWVRFPLDYIFCSTDFGLVQMRRMPPNGSDHFATLVHLVYEPRLENQQAAPEASTNDLDEAKDMASQPLEKENC